MSDLVISFRDIIRCYKMKSILKKCKIPVLFPEIVFSRLGRKSSETSDVGQLLYPVGTMERGSKEASR